ncbi:pancreatic lipase-related protein 2-like [Copidosoma floridanum]|uniref:pancreatic lipase-related protein 2-like n=1 Tax=Copidosoma floridanum TaxID=29053 RepID=UPI000C6F6F97|nr:pancreatic lipase-related protein 2-like [Copidosoma floridanum]
MMGYCFEITAEQNANVILVDWSQGSYSKNYVSAAKNTEIVSNRLLNFLQSAKAQVEVSNYTSMEISWNHLHFIGHSLGAQISGQTAHLLKDDPFWKVERITGLDPAKPCFKELGTFLRLDKEDATFVDIIHTQVGTGGKTDGLGLKEDIGHVDFYVNGGVVQPECTGSSFTPKWNTMICSHKLAYKYFTESISDAINNTCKFLGYPWNGSSDDALQILNSKIVDLPCPGCPEMGINAVRSSQRGKFLVIAAAKEPHCQFTIQDVQSVAKVIKRLKD